jgi:hypothetical protein
MMKATVTSFHDFISGTQATSWGNAKRVYGAAVSNTTDGH